MLLTAEPIDAAEAHRLGGILEVVPLDKLRDRAMELAAKIAEKSPRAVELAKWSLNGIELLDHQEELQVTSRASRSSSTPVARFPGSRGMPSWTSATPNSATSRSAESSTSFGPIGPRKASARSMDLNFSSDQQGIPKGSSGLARGECAFKEPLKRPSIRRRRLRSNIASGRPRLHGGGWAMVPWPEEYGGRGANLLEWLIFEEEYYRTGAPGACQPERHLPARPHHDGVRHRREQKAALSCRRWPPARKIWCAGLVVSPTPAPIWPTVQTLRPNGDGRSLCDQWPENLVDPRESGPTGCFGMFRTDPESEAPSRA